MTRGECQALAGLVREALAQARDMARRSAEVQATAAEFTVIAEEMGSRARAERERARELVGERLRRCHTGPFLVHPGAGQPSPALYRLPPGRAGTRVAIRQPSGTSPSAAAAPTPEIRGRRPVCRRV
jgi:hypothetical protein